ncbi:unnamed protein product [Rangifer tarandus platyrhynchus]|uniref:Uncharacterized protein n=1 Tax=Rangifer tarandus platyrhynchus TaxID=3082113 RepID=A0AC60A830_RANTA
MLVSATQQNNQLFIHTYPLSLVLLPWWLSGEESNCHYGRCGFNPWVGKISWRRKWQPTPVFLPGEFHGRGAWQATVHGVTESTHTCTSLLNLPPRSPPPRPPSHLSRKCCLKVTPA